MSFVVVDGERFEIRERAGQPGQYDFVWVSGPNDGYGYTSARSDASSADAAGLRKSIRSFLAQVNPATGYID